MLSPLVHREERDTLTGARHRPQRIGRLGLGIGKPLLRAVLALVPF
jgi:hypothetical protein